MSSDHFIFVGFERSGPLNTLIDGCEERDRIYLEDPMYLDNLLIDGRRFVGKRIKDGAAVDRIEDTARSVVSLLLRVSAKCSLTPDAALVLAVEDDGRTPSIPTNGEEDAFDYADLVE